jgi:hypothetical protein
MPYAPSAYWADSIYWAARFPALRSSLLGCGAECCVAHLILIESLCRTSHGAPTGISASISFQHPFNRAGGRTSNVRQKQMTTSDTNGTQPRQTMNKRWPRVLRQVLLIFASVFGGWILMWVYLFYDATPIIERDPAWMFIARRILDSSIKYAVLAWAIAVLPLFLTIAPTASMWRMHYCVPLFVIVALLIWGIRVSFDPAQYLTWDLPWILATLGGIGTGIVSSFIQSRQGKLPKGNRSPNKPAHTTAGNAPV